MATNRTTEYPQLSYDALLIHGLMVVAIVVTMIGVRLTSGSNDTDAVLGVGIAATLVFWAWSLVLAIRAERKQESSQWSSTIRLLCILEANVILLILVFAVIMVAL